MKQKQGGAIMRTRFIIPALLAMLVMGAAQAFAQTATVVTQSGQRIRGQLVDMENNESNGSIIVRTNGRDSQIPIDEVMMIDFMGNGTNIPPNEMARANQNNGGLVVLRNGRTLDGQLVDLQPYSNQAVVSGRFGQRNIGLNQVARVYFSGNGYGQYGNQQYGNYGQNNRSNPNYDPNDYPRNGSYGQSGQNGNYGQYGNRGSFGQPGYSNINRTITVPSNQQWTNTGINVQQGQVVHFQASGRISLSNNQGDVGGPAGADSGRLAGNSPMPNVTGGMLIGRVNNGPPFVVGAQSDVTMPDSGRLSLGINDDYVPDNSGNFTVNIR
jgi:small nuclear ribonucleoprotein (snRNP)-like protein